MGASAGENDHWQFELAPAVAGSKGAEEETTAAGPAHAAGSPKQQSFYEKPKGKLGKVHGRHQHLISVAWFTIDTSGAGPSIREELASTI